MIHHHSERRRLSAMGNVLNGRKRWLPLVLLLAAVLHRPHLALANSNLRTLRTFSVHACDGEELHIECWPNTVISINMARYSAPVSQEIQCPINLAVAAPFSSQSANVTACHAQQAQANVEALCKEQRVCKLIITPSTFGGDPCPGRKKYAEVSYKCRPNIFFNKTVCEGDKLRLRCSKSLRIVIYSAEFGSTHSGVSECPQNGHHQPEDCHANYVTETVMENCQGKRKCSMLTSKEALGNPGCSKKTLLFLKVVYTCVPKDTLQDLVLEEETAEEHDSSSMVAEGDNISSSPSSADNRNMAPKSTTPTNYITDGPSISEVSTTRKTDVQSDENTNDGLSDVNCTVIGEDQKVIGFLTEWIAAYKFISDNKEKFILYLTVSLGAGLLVFLVVLAARLYIQQQRDIKKAKLNISEPLPVTMDDECSDTDQYDPRHDRSIEGVRYTDMSTIRRQDSDSHPRAPLSHSMNNYYYS